MVAHISHGTMAFFIVAAMCRRNLLILATGVVIGKLEGTGFDIHYRNETNKCHYHTKVNCKEPPLPDCAIEVKCDPQERAEDIRKMDEADKKAKDFMSSRQLGIVSIPTMPNTSNALLWIALAAGWALLALFLALTMVAFFVKWQRKRRATSNGSLTTDDGGQQKQQRSLDVSRSCLSMSSLMSMEDGTIDLKARVLCCTDQLILGDHITGGVHRVKFNPFDNSESLVLKKERSPSNGHNSVFKEADLMRSLSHSNVMECRMLIRLQPENTVALLMPAMDMDMLQYLKNGTNKEILTLYDLAHQLASALVHVHSLRIIHADLCAQNCLLLIKFGQIKLKLSDFGLSVRLRTNHLSSGVNAIKKRWAPAEVKKPEENGQFPVTFASDIWSFGVTLFEIFTSGTKPYYGIEANQIDHDADSLTSPWDHFFSYASEEAKEAVPLAAKMLMLECFREKAADRIKASAAREQLADLWQEKNGQEK